MRSFVPWMVISNSSTTRDHINYTIGLALETNGYLNTMRWPCFIIARPIILCEMNFHPPNLSTKSFQRLFIDVPFKFYGRLQ